MDNKRSKKEEFAPGYADVLYGIFNDCNLRDCIRMGVVCKTWLSVSKLSLRSRPRQLPWLMMLYNHSSFHLKKDEDEGVRCIFSPSDKTIFGIKFPEICRKRCCGSFNNGWLMMIDDENLDMRLFHPWQRIQLQLPDFPIPPYLLYSVKIIKAAMSDDDRAVVAVILYEGDLAFCRAIDDYKQWTTVRTSKATFYLDLIYYKGQFYAMNMRGGIGVLRINTPNPYVETVIEDKMIEVSILNRTYLLADSTSDSLFIFVRNSRFSDYVHPTEPNKTKGFTVYELGLKDETGEYKENPVEVKSLGDRVIFLGQNSSMLVTASQFPGLKGNCIYFTEDITTLFFGKKPNECKEFGVFNMEDKTIHPLFEDGFHPTFWPPIWIAPPLLSERAIGRFPISPGSEESRANSPVALM